METKQLSFPELVDQLARDRGTATQPDWESPEARLILDAVKMYAMGVAQTALNKAAENVCSRSENMPAAIYWVGPEIEEADIVLP